MLIDDDEPTNFIQERVVQRAHCTDNIRVFDDAELALEYLAKSLDSETDNEYYVKPDIIFLDINMPRTNGWEFIEEYKKHTQAEKDGVIILMLSTSLNPDDVQRANSIREIAGFNNKPLTEEKLMQIIKKHYPEKF